MSNTAYNSTTRPKNIQENIFPILQTKEERIEAALNRLFQILDDASVPCINGSEKLQAMLANKTVAELKAKNGGHLPHFAWSSAKRKANLVLSEARLKKMFAST